MKKVFLAIIALTTLVIACNKTELKENPNTANPNPIRTRTSCEYTSITSPFTNTNLETNLSMLGRLHNECLTYYFNSAQSSGLTKDNQPAFDNHLQSTLKAFNESNGINLNEGSFYPCINSNQVLYSDDNFQTSFSTEAQNIINAVVALLSDETKTYNDYVTGLNQLKANAYALSVENEKISVLCMITVSTYSLEYWNSHLNEWIVYFGGKKTRLSKLGKIGLSDGIGAIRGAIGGGFIGGPIGVFAGALCGAGANSVVRGLVLGFTGY
jgi:hypothetical protein